MVKRVRKKRHGTGLLPVSASIYLLLEAMGGSRERGSLAALWEHWAQVVGDDVASRVSGCRHKGATLILEVEDNLLMQELMFEVETILARVNDFLGREYFTDLRFSLAGTKS